MEEKVRLRVDKYLWAIRIFKTRNLAAEACAGNKVKLNNHPVKASHSVKIGEVYTISISTDCAKIIEVKEFLEKRVSAKLAKNYYLDHSPAKVKKEILPSVFIKPQAKRAKGTGRPTKKDRRNLGDFGWI